VDVLFGHAVATECICRFDGVYFEVQCGCEYAWRYGHECAMVIVLVYISSLSPSLLYLYGRLRCMFSTSYLGGLKQRCSVCNRR